jgi:hypothetical protein
MGEPERRRRRLRPPHGPAGEAPEAADSAPAVAAGDVVIAPPAGETTLGETTLGETAPVETTPGETVPGETTLVETALVESAPIEDPGDEAPRRARAVFAGRARPAAGDEAERGLRGLVGSGSSQVSVGAALRARDAARPTDAQIAEAEQNLAIVRRNWTPREELPRSR